MQKIQTEVGRQLLVFLNDKTDIRVFDIHLNFLEHLKRHHIYDMVTKDNVQWYLKRFRSLGLVKARKVKKHWLYSGKEYSQTTLDNILNFGDVE